MKNLLISLALVCTGFAASAQQTNVNNNPSATLPFYPLNAMVNSGGGTVIANDQLPANTGNSGFSYLNGTNFLGANVISMFSFPQSLNVAFAAVVTGTNASASGNVAVDWDIGTGTGDWIAQIPLTNALSGVATVATSTNINTLAYPFARINKVRVYDTTYGPKITVGYSCKKGL